MEKSGVPTARHFDFVGKQALIEFFDTNETYPIVIKLDGLAAGKGVGIPASREEALAFLEDTVGADTPVYIEDYLTGEEASILGVSDGKSVYPLVVAQDHKRIFDGDKGPNTGGMGAYAPAPVATDEIIERTRTEVLQPVIDTMRKNGIPFKGILYAGMMINKKEINVIEFNVRFGDPEAQVILPLIEGKLVDILRASIEGKITPDAIKFKKKHAITVVMTSKGYPGNYEKGKEITGLDLVSDKVIVFHAGTVRKDGKCYTNGGRVLTVTAVADDLETARNIVYGEIGKISFEGAFYRKDIAHRALK
jgi:phosphoribosylamine---glycine ligase